MLLRSCRRLPGNPDAAVLPTTAEPTRGRHHCELTARFHKDWWRDDCADTSDLRRAVCAVEERAARAAAPFFAELGKRPRMTQLQLLDSLPGSEDQFWHCDNTAQGLTFVIALEDIVDVSGPTELLVGTQRLHDPDSGEFLIIPFLTLWMRQTFNGGENIGENGVRLHKAVLQSRDAFVFDSRTLHRGGANRSSRSRPVVIVRYDPSDHTPPGCGIVATSMLKAVGKILE